MKKTIIYYGDNRFFHFKCSPFSLSKIPSVFFMFYLTAFCCILQPVFYLKFFYTVISSDARSLCATDILKSEDFHGFSPIVTSAHTVS